MKTVKDTAPNLTWMRRVEGHWQAVLDEVLRRGFHGTASVELLIDDGTIQRVARRVERVEK